MMKLPWKPLLTEQRDKSQEGIQLAQKEYRDHFIGPYGFSRPAHLPGWHTKFMP